MEEKVESLCGACPEGGFGEEENICKFVQTKSILNGFNILNFVYEKKAEFPQDFVTSGSYTVCLVMDGKGELHTQQGEAVLRRGDLFFTFPAKPYYIENCGSLQYLYLAFIGTRVSELYLRLHLTPDEPVYHGFSFLCERWLADFSLSTEQNIDLVSEGLLLHTLSFFTSGDDGKGEEIQTSARPEPNAILKIKQYTDLNYKNPDLSLKSVSRSFHYNPKYVSSAFRKMVKISFSEYLRELRMKHAEELLSGGMTHIREIASLCGYTDALYFSKAFKKYFGVSPKRYLSDREEKGVRPERERF